MMTRYNVSNDMYLLGFPEVQVNTKPGRHWGREWAKVVGLHGKGSTEQWQNLPALIFQTRSSGK